MHQLKLSITILTLDLSVVIVKWFEILVTINRGSSQPHVHCPKQADIFEILILNEFYNDVFLWLNLKHLQGETQEGSWFDIPPINSTNKLQFHCFVNDKLGCKSKAFLFPIFRLIDSGPDNFFYQILWICSVYTIGIFYCSVCHFKFDEK